MSSEIAKVEEQPIRMQDLSKDYAEIMVLGKVLFMSGYFKDVRDQAQAVTKILYGRELGISPINSMSAIHIIEGKPALSSNLLAALIKRSGKYDYRVMETTDTNCRIMFRQRNGESWEDVGESSFSIDDAKRAGVVRDGGSWKKYPKAMLFARALSQGERTYCPDVSLSPLYVPEELGATVNEAGEVVTLPAKPEVARTTEPIKINGPAKVAAQAIEIKGETPVSAVVPEGAAGDAPPQREPGSDDDIEACIDLPRQRALHRAFADAIRNEEARKQAAAFLRDWLKHEGYVGPDGKGSTKTIPLYLFEEVRAKALAFAESLPA